MQGYPAFVMHTPQRRLAVGIAASFAAHALVVLAFRADSFREAAADTPPAAESLIVFVKPKPLPTPELRPKPNLLVRETPPRTAQPSSLPDQATAEPDSAAPVIASEARLRPEQDPFYVQPAPQEKPFDMAAARIAARHVATTPDPARADLPVGQFDKERQRVKPDDPVARKIAEAKRRNCKDGIRGGLLGPLLLLMDKKDHGCKW